VINRLNIILIEVLLKLLNDLKSKLTARQTFCCFLGEGLS